MKPKAVSQRCLVSIARAAYAPEAGLHAPSRNIDLRSRFAHDEI
jgi:hypothetical protein